MSKKLKKEKWSKTDLLEFEKYKRMARGFFKNQYNEPFEITTGQADIFRSIYEAKYNRVVIKATTQYGKSDTASMALLALAMNRPEKILIVAPSGKQAGIIMGLIIKHIFDNPLFGKMLEFTGSLERLKEERSKRRITIRNGSEIFILTANARDVSREANALMGFGASIVVVDESSLLPDRMYSRILRMVGGVRNGKLIQLGNPFERNHFGRAFENPIYYKISIDYKQALAEGRLSQEFLDEAKIEMSELEYRIFYGCKFPEGGAADSLIPRAWVDLAVEQGGCEGLKKRGGLDVARFGGDSTVLVRCKGGLVADIDEIEQMDTMEVVGWARNILDEDSGYSVGVDVVGLGAGVYDRLYELDYDVHDINFGSSAMSEEAKDRFLNLRAEAYWNLREKFKPVNGVSKISIPNNPRLIKELSSIKYSFSSEKKIKLEPKEELKKRIGRSPDMSDALALAFAVDLDIEPEMFIL